MNADLIAEPPQGASRDVRYPTYFHLLADVHRRFRPARYLEIGVDQGDSLSLVRPETRIVGVDPKPQVSALNHPDWTVVTATSEEFFRSHDVPGLLGGPVDLAFVDGLHHFEVAMADVLAIEPHAHPGTVVLVHDVVPIDAPTSTRNRTGAVWSGDVWKAVVLLREHRPDLTITTLNVEPTGMAVITGFGGPAIDLGQACRRLGRYSGVRADVRHPMTTCRPWARAKPWVWRLARRGSWRNAYLPPRCPKCARPSTPPPPMTGKTHTNSFLI